MKKIACVGYHATGSGVIDDLFREFDNVAQGVYEAESHFLQAPDGISDLEFHLVECPNRMKTGVAIERFLRFAKETARMHQKIYGPKWFSMCQEYINSISKFQFQGYHDRVLVIKKPYYKYLLLFHRIVNRLRPSKYRKPGWYNYFPNEKEYHARPTAEDFLTKTQYFIEKLCEQIPHNEKTEYFMLDQLVAADNPTRYMRYVKDMKVIVVDRDPRDLYIHHEIHKDHKLPKDPHQFCIYYRDIRKRTSENKDVLYVNFEDMIYNYNEMVEKVLKFVGISPDHHICPKTHFNPAISINGTQLWKKHPEYIKAVKIIEEELPDFLYDYSHI